MSAPARRRVVIGIGNPQRGDDDAGRAVARWLRGTLPPDVEILEQEGEPASLLAVLEGATAAYLVDACASDAPAGTIRRFDAGAAALPQGAVGLSTHALGLAEALELARALGQLPARCLVYAIEAGDVTPGAPLSAPVAEAIAEVGERLRAEIAEQDVQAET